jgi:CheY-like chemotaxis protein
MKKPLILLVDDDRAVLDALEAELRPAFEEIARIEAFDDPRAVLDALPDWAAEDRAIAVAIVDQKMPERTGVELLVRLRELAHAATAAGATFHPAAHLRAVLLTGYAELDAAVAAKNEAGVDRYVEKPWRAEALRSSASAALRRWLEDSGAGVHFVFREVTSDDEVREMLQMRFAVYAQTNALTRNLLPSTPVGLDPYEQQMVGTLRVAGQAEGPAREALERVVAADDSLLARVRAARRYPLPLMTYLVDRDAVQQLFDRLVAAGEMVVEPGRLTLAPAWRGNTGTSERHLARHIIDGAVASFFFFFRVQNAILTCVPLHVAMYRGYGFGETEGTRTQFHPAVQSDVACLHGRSSTVPSPARERCSALAARIARTGAACRCAAFPSCLGGPYETGRFADADLLCPALAREVVQGLRTRTE